MGPCVSNDLQHISEIKIKKTIEEKIEKTIEKTIEKNYYCDFCVSTKICGQRYSSIELNETIDTENNSYKCSDYKACNNCMIKMLKKYFNIEKCSNISNITEKKCENNVLNEIIDLKMNIKIVINVEDYILSYFDAKHNNCRLYIKYDDSEYILAEGAICNECHMSLNNKVDKDTKILCDNLELFHYFQSRMVLVMSNFKYGIGTEKIEIFIENLIMDKIKNSIDAFNMTFDITPFTTLITTLAKNHDFYFRGFYYNTDIILIKMSLIKIVCKIMILKQFKNYKIISDLLNIYNKCLYKNTTRDLQVIDISDWLINDDNDMSEIVNFLSLESIIIIFSHLHLILEQKFNANPKYNFEYNFKYNSKYNSISHCDVNKLLQMKMTKTITNIINVYINKYTDIHKMSNNEKLMRICGFFGENKKSIEITFLNILLKNPLFFYDIIDIIKNSVMFDTENVVKFVFSNINNNINECEFANLAFEEKTCLFDIINKNNKLNSKIILQVYSHQHNTSNINMIIKILNVNDSLYNDLCKHLALFNIEYDILEDIKKSDYENIDNFVIKIINQYKTKNENKSEILTVLKNLNLLTEKHIIYFFNDKIKNLEDFILFSFDEYRKCCYQGKISNIVLYTQLMKLYFNKNMENDIAFIFNENVFKYVYCKDYHSFIYDKQSLISNHKITELKNSCDDCGKCKTLTHVHCINVCDTCIEKQFNNTYLVCYNCKTNMLPYVLNQFKYRT